MHIENLFLMILNIVRVVLGENTNICKKQLKQLYFEKHNKTNQELFLRVREKINFSPPDKEYRCNVYNFIFLSYEYYF